MAKDGKSTATPRLRFPEFREAGAWERKKLSDLLIERKQRNRELKYGAHEVLSVSGEYGCVNQIELLGRSYAGASVKDYHVVETGDIVYTKSPLKKNPFGIIKENKGKPGIVSTLYAVYHATDMGHPAYLDHYFSRDYNLNSYLQPIVRKGAKNDMKVNNSAVLGGEIFAPKVEEQQKIADCLTSLNEVIAAQARKVEALKAHKRGLMQRLFPREGETLPRLRFPDFRDGLEWEEIPLNSLAKRITIRNSGVGQTRVLTNSAEFGVVDQGEYFDREIVTKENLDNYFVVETGDFVYNPRVSTTAPVGPVSRNNLGQGVMSPLYTIFRFTSPSADYFAYLFKTSAWHRYLRQVSNSGARHDRMNISTEDFMSLPLPVPSQPEERQRIADCLSSLDAQVAAETEKLDAFKTHKKGLMQQLFPSRERD